MLERLKQKLVEIAQKADKSGLCRHKSGNFSIRDSKTGFIVITPSGISRETLETKHIVIVDIDGNVIEKKSNVKPSSEMKMHLKAYKVRKDIFGIAHTHSPYATAFAVQAMEIKPVVFQALAYGGRVPVAKYQRPGTKELADSIIKPLQVSDACLLEKHGVLTVGKDLDDAYLKAHYVEDVAKIVIFAKVLGNGILPDEIPNEDFKAVINP
ncbi:class II aldolase/adducin family protein [Thermohalobacter berrensis]|uniref:Aldolase n=1 Tax=Thermohalobacter berrensis TaxID=99594 RepID=A0A419SZ98_9FIRM|nr:class II aldolase/adducin family protein [Thermohalobacter berrensis]RKD30521.1 aldolase [Thermohalobacter berrensis]